MSYEDQPRDAYGRWTDSGPEGLTQSQPLRKKMMIDDEVIFRGPDGKLMRGQLGFRNGDKYEVELVDKIDHPTKAGYKFLKRTGQKVLVPRDSLRIPTSGFKSRDFRGA